MNRFDEAVANLLNGVDEKEGSVRFSIGFTESENKRLEDVVEKLIKKNDKKLTKQRFVNTIVMAAVADLEKELES